MSYFNYHAIAKKLITDGKLLEYFYIDNYKSLSPALILVFNDLKHPIMPIRENKWDEYKSILPKEKFKKDCFK